MKKISSAVKYFFSTEEIYLLNIEANQNLFFQENMHRIFQLYTFSLFTLFISLYFEVISWLTIDLPFFPFFLKLKGLCRIWASQNKS